MKPILFPRRPIRVAALTLALLGAGAVGAQPAMTPPACQCSAPTAVPALSMTVVHCLCGGVSCVLSSVLNAGKPSEPLMQCVK